MPVPSVNACSLLEGDVNRGVTVSRLHKSEDRDSPSFPKSYRTRWVGVTLLSPSKLQHQLAPLPAADTANNSGRRARKALSDVPLSSDGGIINVLVSFMIEEARLVNAAIDFLLFSPSYSGDLDLLFGFLALPVVYYLTAIAVALSGRAIYRFGRKRLSA